MSWAGRSQCLADRPTVERHVVEGLARQRLGHVARIRSIGADHDDPGVVIVHGKSPVILRAPDLTHILPLENADTRDVPRGRHRAGAKGSSVAHIDDDGGPIVSEDVTEAGGPDFGHPPERPPDGNAELITPDVAVSCREQLLCQALALSTVRTVAVENNAGRL